MIRRRLDINHAHNSAKIITSLHKIVDKIGLLKNEHDHEISALIERIENHLNNTSDTDEFLSWQIVVTGLYALRSQLQCHEIARGGTGEILSEREKLYVLCSDLRDQLFRYYGKENKDRLLIDSIIKQDND